MPVNKGCSVYKKYISVTLIGHNSECRVIIDVWSECPPSDMYKQKIYLYLQSVYFRVSFRRWTCLASDTVWYLWYTQRKHDIPLNHIIPYTYAPLKINFDVKSSDNALIFNISNRYTVAARVLSYSIVGQ